MSQLVTQLVCQVCGRVTQRDSRDAKHWLNEPHRSAYWVNVVRCPQHWSEWALRHTQKGRTKDMRARMKIALAQPAPVIPPLLSPFPTTNKFK